MKYFLLLILLISFNVKSDVHDKCSDILSQGIYDIYRFNYSVEIKQSLQKWAKNSIEGSEKLKGDIIETFGVSFSGQKKMISDKYKDDRFQGTWATHIMMKYVNGNIVNAWKDCMKRKNNGFVYYSKEEYGEVKVVYEHQGIEYGPLSNVIVSTRNLTQTGGKPYPNEIPVGSKNTHFFKRSDKNGDARFYFYGKAKFADIDFSIVIPPVKVEILEDDPDYYEYKGFKIYERCSYWKNDIANYENVLSVEECASICYRLKGCKSFSWFLVQNRCWLHDNSDYYRYTGNAMCGKK